MKKILQIGVLFFAIGGLMAQVANQPDDIQLCDDDGDGISAFDLTFTESQIFGGQSPADFFVTYHETEADAIAGTNAIANPSNYVNLVNPQTIYARLESLINGNFDTTNFSLIVLPAPTPASPTPFQVCDDDGDGIALFDLNSKDAEIANGEPSVIITYHESLADAANGINALASPYFNTVPFNQLLHVRVESDVNGCFLIVELQLVVLVDCPFIDTPPEDVFVNEGDDNGLAIFDLTVNESLMLGSQDPALFNFTYHDTLGDSDAGTNAISDPSAYQNIANPQTIYVRMTNNDNGSYVLTDFVIETDGVLGLDDLSIESIAIYPNPASDRLIVHTTNKLDALSLQVFDMRGSLLISENKESIDITGLPSGMYFIQISSNGNRVTKPFAKE